MLGGGGHTGVNAVTMGNPGSHDTGGLGHAAHGHDRAQGGPHTSGSGKTIRGAAHLAFHLGQKQHQPRLAMRGIAHAQPEGPGVDPAAVDRITEPVTYQQAKDLGIEPTRVFLTHVVNHDLIFHSREFRDRARRMGLDRLDTRIPNLDGLIEKSKRLMAWHAWVESLDPTEMPDGWREGFTGKTFIVREYWGIGFPGSRTVLEVCWIVWWYDQTAVWETKQTIRIVSFEIYDETNDAYGYIIKAFNDHQMAAWRLSVSMFEALKAAAPNAAQTALINWYGTNEPRHDEGVYPGTKVDESELIDEALEEARDKDLKTAKDSKATIDGSFTPPADSDKPVSDGQTGDQSSNPVSFAFAPSTVASGRPELDTIGAPKPQSQSEAEGEHGKGKVTVRVKIPKLKK